MELEPPRHHRATAKAPTHPQHDSTSEQQRFCKPKEGHTPKQTLEMASNDGFAKQAATVFEKNAFSWRDRTDLHAICALHVCKPVVGCHAPPQSRSTPPRIFAEPSQDAILPRKMIVSVLPISQKRHRTPFAARKRTTAPWRGGCCNRKRRRERIRWSVFHNASLSVSAHAYPASLLASHRLNYPRLARTKRSLVQASQADAPAKFILKKSPVNTISYLRRTHETENPFRDSYRMKCS